MIRLIYAKEPEGGVEWGTPRGRGGLKALTSDSRLAFILFILQKNTIERLLCAVRGEHSLRLNYPPSYG